MPVFLLKYWRYVAVLLLCLVCFLAGRFGGTTSTTKTSDTIHEKTAETQKLDETVQDHDVTQLDKVTTTTKKPDGTVVTVVTDHTKIIDSSKKTEDETDKKTSQKTEVKTETKTTAGAKQSGNWSLGLNVQNDVSLKWNPDYQAQVSYRLVGPLWGNAIYDISAHKPAVGFTIIFP